MSCTLVAFGTIDGTETIEGCNCNCWILKYKYIFVAREETKAEAARLKAEQTAQAQAEKHTDSQLFQSDCIWVLLIGFPFYLPILKILHAAYPAPSSTMLESQ